MHLSFTFPIIGNLIVKSRFLDLPNANHVNHLNQNVSLMFFPGTLVKTDEYNPILDKIKLDCESRNIQLDVKIIKFQFDCMHRFEIDSVTEDVNTYYNNNNYSDIVFFSHSAGGPVAMNVVRNMTKKPSLILWGSTFNSDGDFPWEGIDPLTLNTTSLTLLAEKDNHLPFPIALKEYCDNRLNGSNTFVCDLPGFGHFSGIRSMGNSKISKIVSTFIESQVLTTENSIKYFDIHHKSFLERYSTLSKPQDRVSINNDFEDGSITTSSVDSHFHYSVPPDMFLTFLYIAIPIMKPFIHNLIILPSFVSVQPTKKKSYSFSPLPDILPFAVLNSPPTWVKIDGLKKSNNRARDMNIRIFEKALDSVTTCQKQRYLKDGKKIRFGDDISIPLFPACSVLWLITPLMMINSSRLIVKSPTIDIGSRMNAKLISKQECIEWIVSKSLI